MGDRASGLALIPGPVQRLGGASHLNDEIAGEILRFSLASFFAPKAQQRALVRPHDDPGVRAADEGAGDKGSGDNGRLERDFDHCFLLIMVFDTADSAGFNRPIWNETYHLE